MLNDLQYYYRTLELESGATWTDVKRSYRELVKVHRRHQRPGARGRYREGPGVAGPRGRFYHQALR